MLIELLIFCVSTYFTYANSYIATFPNSLIPGVNLDTRVTVLGATGPVHVLASLHHVSNNSEISSTSKQVSNGVPSTLPIKVPEGLPLSQYKVSISGSGGLTFRNESKIRFEDKNLFIFLQTDKTRYSAGQQVRYRAILLHPNLLGYKGTFTITIFDGNDNKIEVIDHLKTKDGVVTGKLVLSKEPVFGKWRINVNTDTESLTKNFEVNDYVVPRFSVDIALPAGIKTTATSVDISVSARFTFNADVLGNCTIQIYVKDNPYQFVEYWKQIKGKVNFTVDMTDLRNTFTSLFNNIIVRALVTDNATALTIAAEEDLKFSSDQTFPTYTSQQTLTITKIDKRDTFVPGLTYHTPVFVGYGDEPVGSAGFINVIPTVTTAEERLCLLNNPPTRWLDKRTTILQNFTIAFDESGYAALNVPVSNHTDLLVLQLSYGTTQNDVTLYSVSSRPVPLLRMNVDKVHTRVGENLTIFTEATEFLGGLISYEIYARGILLKTVVNRLAHAKRTYIDLEVTGDMVPQMYVVATHLTPLGHLLSDYVTFKVDGSPCKNKVSIKYNTTVLEPRGGLQMEIKADPNSTVYIMIEDEKNRLLGTENDVYLSEIADTIEKSNRNVKSHTGRKRRYDSNMPLTLNGYRWILKYVNYTHEQEKLFRRSNSNVGDDIYHESGVVVLSDIDMYQRTDTSNLLMFDTILPKKCIHITTLPPVTYPYGVFPGQPPTPAPGVTYAPNNIPTPAPGMTYAPGQFPTWVPGMVPTPAPGQTYAPGMATTPVPASVAAKDILRNRFPETWLWEEYHIGPSGKHFVIQTAPDAITSWITSVFATNPDTGFGISEVKQKISVKKSFFLTMDLPSSIILGEEVLVQITVFNYMAVPQQVFLQVVKSDDPTHPIPAATMVQPNEGHSTYIRVTPTALGTLKINVHAKAGFFSTSATDALEKEVAVLPLGVHKTTNEQHLVDVNSGGQTFTQTLLLKDHPNIISGTKNVYMKITGDFLVPSIEGLQNLINLPNGCGEQTMLNLAPDVFLTKYMNVTGQLTRAVEDRALQFIRSGYQHELGFRHYDGSFSIWGSIRRLWKHMVDRVCFKMFSPSQRVYYH
ncbi:CD109 antigen-like [Mercenaria mercenaria]|uniref:CD109 antigen-like n=1 Tax=Mercenaria mercenaria TaxID=6596 RepID=UPI00234E4ABE|nr:CD109 antigen-like [Mercenaria mercenaria]